MKPLRLEVAGFARFREPQVISFEDLDLFAISGPTGAGKTLILDALCYALYGVTPRLSQKLDGLISSGADRLMVDLQFEAGSGVFRVVRTMERKPSSIAKSTRIERLEDGRWLRIPETEKLVEADRKLQEIVGFDFQAFTRSILLPQGKFDEFLHGEARQRRSLLKELLDLKRIDEMREEAGKRERAEATRVEAINQRLEGDGLATVEDDLRELRASLRQLELEQRTATGRLSRLRADLAAAERLAGQFEELAQVRADLQLQRQAASEAPALQAELSRGRAAAAALPLLEKVEGDERQASESAAELARLQAKLPELRGQAEAAESARTAAARDRVEREPVLRAKLARLQQQVPLARRLARLGGAPAGEVANAAPWDEEQLERLLELRSGLGSLNAARERVERSAASLKVAEQQEREYGAELERISGKLQDTLEQGTAIGERVRELQEQLRHAGGEHFALINELRGGLEPGASCPVCGQAVVDHLPAEGIDLGPLQEDLSEAQTRREALLDEYRDLQAAEASARTRLQGGSEARSAAEAEAAAAREALTAAAAPYVAAGLPGDPAELTAGLNERVAAQLAALARNLQEAGAGEDAEAAAAALERELDAVAEAERGTASEAARVQQELKGLEGRLELHAAQRERQQAELSRSHQELHRHMDQAGFADRDALRGALRSQERLSEIEQLLIRAGSELERLSARESDLVRATGDQTDPRPGLQALRDEAGTLEVGLQELSQRRGELQARLGIAEQRSAERTRLIEERRQREDQQEVWKLLATDLMDNRFTDFLLADLQRRLALQASRIIRQVTDDRFDLSLSENREFQVSDAWAGGEKRPVKSLSGGETFIVSLALALALSETAAGGRRLGALFLDEGFGTLDAQTLDAVAGVLESLSTGGRMVGLITHVPELSARMPARLVVQKEADGSSVYWED